MICISIFLLDLEEELVKELEPVEESISSKSVLAYCAEEMLPSFLEESVLSLGPTWITDPEGAFDSAPLEPRFANMMSRSLEFNDEIETRLC